jgi:hypothetical protein
MAASKTTTSRILPLESGIYKSEAFPGLWLDAAALIRSDQAELFNVLNQGLASAEHRAFVGRLEKMRAGGTP